MKDIYAAKLKKWYADTLQSSKYDSRLSIPLLVQLLKDEFGITWKGKTTRKAPLWKLIQQLEYPVTELIAEPTTEPVVENETDLQEVLQPEVIKQPATSIITDYQLQLDDLRQQEDELFKQALANPQEAQLAQFKAIWTQRDTIHKQIENTTTLMSTEPIQILETQEQSPYTIEELQAIPKMNMHCPELAGKLFYSLNNRPQLIKGFKVPATIIGQYELSPRQVAILEGKLRIAPQIEDVPSRYDNYSESVKNSEAYAYTAEDIIMGRF